MTGGKSISHCRRGEGDNDVEGSEWIRIRIRTVERPLVGDVVYQQDAHGTSVVRGGDGAEPLLAGGIPDLQLDTLAIELDCPDLEVDTDRRDEGRREGVLAETQQAARLAYT